jgi:hypothetical protein
MQGAHYILRPFGEGSDLRRWGLKLAERGGKNLKSERSVVVLRNRDEQFPGNIRDLKIVAIGEALSAIAFSSSPRP